MKARLIIALTLLMTVGLVSSSGCFPSEHGRTYYFAKDKKEKKSKKGWLGVSIEDVTRRLSEREDLKTSSGAYVSDVTENSPADDAGIEKGDVIIKYDGRDVDGSDDLTSMVRDTKPGTKVDIVVERDKEQKTLSAEIESLSSSGSYSYSYSYGDNEPFRVQIPKPPRVPHAYSMPHIEMFNSNYSLHGLVVENLTKQLAEYFQVPGKKGVLVTEVKKNSPADKAGFNAGDVITKVGSSSVWDSDDLQNELRDGDKGDEYNFEVIRKGNSTNLKMKFDKDADDDDDWSFYVAPHAKGYYFRNNLDLRSDMQIHKETLRQLSKQLRESLRQNLGETRRRLEEVKDQLRRELGRI